MNVNTVKLMAIRLSQTMSLTLITDTSPASIDRLARCYAASFDARTFYVVRAIFAGLPPAQVERLHSLRLRQKVYRSIVNPQHEVWAVLDAGEATGVRGHGGKEVEGAEGAEAETEAEAAAVMILKLPSDSDTALVSCIPRLTEAIPFQHRTTRSSPTCPPKSRRVARPSTSGYRPSKPARAPPPRRVCTRSRTSAPRLGRSGAALGAGWYGWGWSARGRKRWGWCSRFMRRIM